MTNVLQTAHLVDMIRTIAATLGREVSTLNALDAALGDGDHGTGISTAFAQAAEQVGELESPQPADVLRTTAMVLMNRMGGASGALNGTLFLKASTAVVGKSTLTVDDVAAMWRAGLEGVMQRGKAQAGDKTMIDALLPVVETFEKATTEDDDLLATFQAAARTAQDGAERTAEMVAKHGRAKFVGERALGHADAGATSIALIFQAMYESLIGANDGEA